MRLRPLFALSWCAVACGGLGRAGAARAGDMGTAVAPSSATPSASATASPEGHAGAYLALFDNLVAKIEAHHVFADKPKARWPDAKKALRAEFETVRTRAEAFVALDHLEAALGDRHCYMTPPSDLRQMRLSLGITVFPEETGGEPTVYVDDLLDPAIAGNSELDIQSGDRIVAIDGVSLGDYLTAHPFESNSLNPAMARAETVGTIASAHLPYSLVKKGDVRTLRLRRGDKEHDAKLAFVHPSKWEDAGEQSFDDAPAMASVGCRHDRSPLYDDFELSAVGTNLCVYKPTKGKRDTRLVRFISFDYARGEPSDGLRAARADHDLLLRELAGAKAVVLDVHENHGGNNPFVFLSWFIGKPWDHQQIHTKPSTDFNEDELRQDFFGSTERVRLYRDAATRGVTDLSWPFECLDDAGKPVQGGTCESKGPRPKERVTEAPVAMVTGFECTSSCDSIASEWAAFHMGPIVGQQPAHGFTTVRHAYSLVGPDGRDLGQFRISLSWEEFPRDGKPLEGREIALDWEAPASFAEHKHWVAASVDKARGLVEKP